MRRLTAVTATAATFTLASCYEHPVRTSGDPGQTRQVYDANLDDSKPGFFDQLFWGDPPAGQDAAEYYRLKRAGQPIPPVRVPQPTKIAPEPPSAAPSSLPGDAP